MVIVGLVDALGNQFYQYACGRSLAKRLNTELKIDLGNTVVINQSKPRGIAYYRLGVFNIVEDFATPQEIQHVITNGIKPRSFAQIQNVKGDVYITGSWMFYPPYYDDIIDLLRKEFTLKKPFSPHAEKWKNKILSAECSVSMHFRLGDKIYNPFVQKLHLAWTVTLPLQYYYTCIDILKEKYKNITLFVFTDNVSWCKENLHVDVPVEFIEGCEADYEDWILMSLCKKNIVANSTFGKSAANLNSNPDKQVFYPGQSNAEYVKKFLDSLTPDKKHQLNSNTNCTVPFDFSFNQEITLSPFFSFCLVVNNDVTTIANTLDSLLSQDYKYYEIIIIDNASTDGSRQICHQKIADRKDVTFRRLHSKVTNAKAWNVALSLAQGRYVSFLKGKDKVLPNAITNLWKNDLQRNISLSNAEVMYCFFYLQENDNGSINFNGKKFSNTCAPHFQNEKREKFISRDTSDLAGMLLQHQIDSFLGTKIFNRDFLIENKIKFHKQLDDTKAELFFQVEAFFYSNYTMYLKDAFYIAPPITLDGGHE